VATGTLIRAAKRNAARFPPDFMFRPDEQDLANLRSQNVISSWSPVQTWGGRRTLPYAFSEQGVAMLSSVLRSARAIAADLARKLDDLERKVAAQGEDITGIVRAIRQLAAPPEGKPKRAIGFVS
jgi:hypothetical protein